MERMKRITGTDARMTVAMRSQALAEAEWPRSSAWENVIRANVTSNARDLSRPYVQWMRNEGSNVYHATVESAELSWIGSGQAACGFDLPRPGWVLLGLPSSSSQKLCSRCTRKLETMYPVGKSIVEAEVGR